mmetsp:Transcript_760/g.2194  ORF Transcript_760/g.2194 Transcript_760/m.2194 type:complete len:203 (+) Transcript_760:1032-1640(+)
MTPYEWAATWAWVAVHRPTASCGDTVLRSPLKTAVRATEAPRGEGALVTAAAPTEVQTVRATAPTIEASCGKDPTAKTFDSLPAIATSSAGRMLPPTETAKSAAPCARSAAASRPGGADDWPSVSTTTTLRALARAAGSTLVSTKLSARAVSVPPLMYRMFRTAFATVDIAVPSESWIAIDCDEGPLNCTTATRASDAPVPS